MEHKKKIKPKTPDCLLIRVLFTKIKPFPYWENLIFSLKHTFNYETKTN